ncbi:MAG: glycosyltransferase family 4 protein [Bacteroidales bacterium]|nr:glycosyltransferase family 4 protein [Bacteroidales bacterium]
MQKKPLKIAVNTRLLLHEKIDGIGRFAFETLKQMVVKHPEHQFLFIFDRPYHESFVFADNIIPVIIPPPARHPLLFLAWFELSLPVVFKKHKPDVFLSPDGYLSLRSDIPSVAVIHDLNFEQYPADLPWAMRMYLQKMFPKFADHAKRIATVSAYSKQDISNRYNVPLEKIDIVHNGTSSSFCTVNDSEKDRIRKKYTSGRDYFFFVGTLHPRKNLTNLFRAFDAFKNADRHGIKLVIAGAKMWWTEEIRTTYEGMKFREDVVFTGRVNDNELVNLMSSALALTYVSYFEGFGIPILEAFNCETPVITSNTTSMPEVAGDAALLVDPFSVESITQALHSIADDPILRQKLVQKGSIQKNQFSWEMTSDKLWKTIEQCQ